MAGSATRTIELSIAAISIPSVVMNAIRLLLLVDRAGLPPQLLRHHDVVVTQNGTGVASPRPFRTARATSATPCSPMTSV